MLVWHFTEGARKKNKNVESSFGVKEENRANKMYIFFFYAVKI